MDHNFISIDIETLGIDKNCTIIEFGAVMEVTGVPLDQLPTFHKYLKPAGDSLYQGELYALSMHAKLLETMKTETLTSPVSLCYVFNDWLKTLGVSGSIQIAGKNFSTFDLPFLDKHCEWSKRVQYKRRILDLGSMFYEYGKPVPSLEQCLQVCGFEPTVGHTALSDAYDVIRCIRYKQGMTTTYKICEPKDLIGGEQYWVEKNGKWEICLYSEYEEGKFQLPWGETIRLTKDLRIRGPVLKPNEVPLAELICQKYSKVLRDAASWQEMMVERKHSELVVGATYFTRNLLIGDWTVIRYEYEIKEIIDLCKDTMCFIGPIPMPNQ